MRISVTDFGAVGDGKRNNAASFARALDVLRQHRGGELVVPAGEYLCGGIRLIDNLTLHLEEGAVLKASPGIADHDPFESGYADSWLSHSFISGRGIRNCRITGPGEINGNGDAFWEKVYQSGIPFGELPADLPVIRYNVLKPKAKRPVTLYLEDCRDVGICGVTFRNASCYTVWAVSCRDLVIERVTIRNFRWGPNTDGLDVDCSQNVTIRDCDVVSGDDCVAIKSDPNRFGRMEPCENVRVENCRLSSATCAIRIGYEGDAPIRGVTCRNLEICDSRHGIDVLSIAPVSKMKIDSGTPMDDFLFENCRMTGVGQAFFIWSGNEPPRHTYAGHVCDLTFRNMQIEALASSFIGSEKPGAVSGIVLENVTMHVADLPGVAPVSDFHGMPDHWGDWWKCGGLRLHNGPGVVFRNCAVTCDQPGFGPVEKSTGTPIHL